MAPGETVGSEHSSPFLLAQQEPTSLLARSCILLPAADAVYKMCQEVKTDYCSWSNSSIKFRFQLIKNVKGEQKMCNSKETYIVNLKLKVPSIVPVYIPRMQYAHWAKLKSTSLRVTIVMNSKGKHQVLVSK